MVDEGKLQRVAPPPGTNPRFEREYAELHERMGLDPPFPRSSPHPSGAKKTIRLLATFVLPLLGVLLPGAAALLTFTDVHAHHLLLVSLGAIAAVLGVLLSWKFIR